MPLVRGDVADARHTEQGRLRGAGPDRIGELTDERYADLRGAKNGARGLWFRGVAVGAAVALVGVLCASLASAAPPAGVSMEGTGPQPSGLGLFSDAALAQKTCADNGRTTSTYAGGGPWCVNPWSAGQKNGGATAQGVTATTVKVVAYLPNDQMQINKSNVNLANGQPSALPDVMVDFQKAYQAIVAQYGTYQLWGRTPDIESVIATGPDEASQRADAVAVIAKKPFIVFDMTATTTTGAAVFSSLVAAKKIVMGARRPMRRIRSSSRRTGGTTAPTRAAVRQSPRR